MNNPNPFIVCMLCMLAACSIQAQTCALAVDFDGVNDYIEWNATGSAVAGDADFTVELWFSIASPITGTCVNNFRRLFVLTGTVAPVTRFEIGECDHQLKIFYPGVTPPPGFAIETISGTLPPGCHHLAVVRSGPSLNVYLDGAATPLYSGTIVGALNTNLFRVGHWHGGATPGQDWWGMVDEVRVWSVPRTPVQISDFMDCSLTGPWPGLEVSWTFDQPGIMPVGNNVGAMALDMSGNGNHGAFTNFALNGSTSNFVQNTCPQRYEVSISDFPAPFPVLLASICSGDPAHFCITENGNAVGSLAGASVAWQYSDDNGITWQPVSTPSFSGYCFYVPQGEIDISADCAISTTGYVDRKYCAMITTSMGGGQSCTYTTSAQDLRICCPVSATVVLSPQPPIPAGHTLCEGTVTIDVTLTGVSFLSNLSIEWCIDGIHAPSYNNMTSFTYTGPANASSLCFEAKIQNCACPQVKVQSCIPVDPLPMCGLIDGMSSNLIQTATPYEYLICPGNDAAVGMLNPLDFKNCNAVWQYRLDTDPAGQWKDLLGTGNAVQNTNTLPQVIPPNNPGSPYLWPPGATCITYRIECRPLSHPNSGCPPCHSNEVKICLQPPPPNGVISGNMQICKPNGSTLLTVNPFFGSQYNYNWFLDGIGPIDNGQTHLATSGGCYVVEISDWCQAVTTPPFCVEACTVLPVITCPVDNPCACDGQPITLIGCNSLYTCTNTGPLPLVYSWSASNGAPGTPGGPNGCEFTHTPDPGGTWYFLTVTDPNLGCSATASLFIEPCQ